MRRPTPSSVRSPPPTFEEWDCSHIRRLREKPLIAFPAITVILNQAGVLMNDSPPPDTPVSFTSLIFHLLAGVTASPALPQTRPARLLHPNES